MEARDRARSYLEQPKQLVRRDYPSAMNTAFEMSEWLRARIGRVYERPLMYATNAEAVDLILHYYHEIWVELAGSAADLLREERRVRDRWECGASGFAMRLRELHPHCTEQQLAERVVSCWREITTALKIEIPEEAAEQAVAPDGAASRG